ncbi:MAG: choice-of-anchor D domain-containing protein [Verrucomicrobiota bacterium]
MKPVLLFLLFASSALAQVITGVERAAPTPPAIQNNSAGALAAPPPEEGPDFTTQTTQYSIGNPTDEEQYYLELINRARANPTAEGIMLATTTHPNVLSAIAQFGVDLNLMKTEFSALPVRPPLAINALLTTAARGHTQFQFDTATQAHTGSGGSLPWDRVEAAGYQYSSIAESVFATARDVFHGHAGFQIDWGGGGTGGMQAGRGHRMNNHGDFREAGIGVKLGSNTVGQKNVGPQLVTQNFATSLANDQAFVTGVAYYDMNANSIFDPGEGIGGLTVNVNGSTFHAVTAATGGYAVPVPISNATYAVTFTGLNANGGSDAVIAGGANVKVDFIPTYTPPTPSGPDVASTATATNYRFNPVIGATGYKGRSVANVDLADDGADNTNRVTVTKSGSYNTINTAVKDSGTGSFHLANPVFGDQIITYNAPFHVKAGGSLSIRSRLRTATSDQIARVQVSSNNGTTWEDIYSQPGGAAEGAFVTRSLPLTNFVNKDIQVRFNFSVSSGSINNSAGDTFGWFVDTVNFTSLVDASTSTVTTLPAGTTFPFTAAAAGDFLLSVSPIISGKDFGFGVAKVVTASAAPPAVGEVYVEQAANTPLTDGASVIAFGTKTLNDDEVRTFTIRNDGTAALTGLALSVAGAHPGDFVTGNLGATTLAPGANTTFTVTFTAANGGGRTATLRIASNDADENPFDVPLAGTVIAPPSLSEITIEQVGGAALTSGGTVNFGLRKLNDDETLTFKIRNDGTEDLSLGGFSMTGVNPGEFLSSGTGLVNVLVPGAEVNFTITFTAVTVGVRTAKLQIANGDATEDPFEITLSGRATNGPTIDTEPASLVALEGAGATFEVVATHPNLVPTYQWKKNNVNIKNATTDKLEFVAVKAADVGTYTVVVSAGDESVTSVPVTLVAAKFTSQLLVIVENTVLKPTVTLTGAATLTWTKTSGDPAVTGVIAVQTAKTLVLGPLSAATGSGVYKVQASVPGGNSLLIGEFDVRVFNAKPQVTQNQAFPPFGAIGSHYSHQIKLNGGLNESPVSYSARNLPTGLTLNTKTGAITGVPTVAKTFKVSVTATNGWGSTSSAGQDVVINPLPLGVAGSFVGMVDRDPILNANLGGRLDFTISSAGAITGSMTMGTLKHPFKGNIQVDTLPPSAFIEILRTGKPRLLLELDLDHANNRIAASTEVNDGIGGNSAAITGWRNVWSTLNLATAVSKLYTYALKPPAAPPDMPRGDGYGSFTLGKDGKLTAAGKLADGEGHTCASFAGPQGQILIFQTFTTTKGSVIGTLDIDHNDDGFMDDDGLTGMLSWLRPANAKSRVYKDGFGPVDITAVGARYVAPVAPALVLGITQGLDKARITFADGGLASAVINPNVPEFDILVGNKVSFVGAVNSGTVKITALSAATGVFSGTFLLDDNELRGGTFAGKKLKRTATFNGILTHDGAAQVGLGHFLLEEMPKDGAPPIGTTPATSAKLSGSVVLDKKP